MLKLRKSADRGHFRSDWLDSYHTFSFDTYYDPAHMGFRTLRVINQDRVQPGHGFPLHPHNDMEILSFVLVGELRHEDNLGHSGVIRAGEVQRISAGSGIRHSESNPSQDEEVHFLQIWIVPEEKGLEPSYEQRRFAPPESNRLQLLASPDGRDASVKIHQDVTLYSGETDPGGTIDYALDDGRHAWVQVVTGELDVNGCIAAAGDGVAVSDESSLRLKGAGRAQFILFDLN